MRLDGFVYGSGLVRARADIWVDTAAVVLIGCPAGSIIIPHVLLLRYAFSMQLELLIVSKFSCIAQGVSGGGR